MLLFFGNSQTKDGWIINEKNPTIYIRSYFVYSGDVTYKDDFQEVKLKSNHLYIFPTDKPYSITQNPDDKLDHLFVRYIINQHTVSDIVEIDLEEDEYLHSIERALNYALTRGSNAGHREMYIPLIEAYIAYIKHRRFATKIESQINNAIEIITRNLDDNINLEEISQLCGYSKNYFGKLFKKETGLTPYRYMLEYKMKVAKTMLEDGYNVTETAARLGFSETRSFSRCYKDYHSVNPSHIHNKHPEKYSE